MFSSNPAFAEEEGAQPQEAKRSKSGREVRGAVLRLGTTLVGLAHQGAAVACASRHPPHSPRRAKHPSLSSPCRALPGPQITSAENPMFGTAGDEAGAGTNPLWAAGAGAAAGDDSPMAPGAIKTRDVSWGCVVGRGAVRDSEAAVLGPCADAGALVTSAQDTKAAWETCPPCPSAALPLHPHPPGTPHPTHPRADQRRQPSVWRCGGGRRCCQPALWRRR